MTNSGLYPTVGSLSDPRLHSYI